LATSILFVRVYAIHAWRGKMNSQAKELTVGHSQLDIGPTLTTVQGVGTVVLADDELLMPEAEA